MRDPGNEVECNGFSLCAKAKLSLRLEYVPPKPAKVDEGEITAVDETDLGAEPGEEGFEDEGLDEGGGAEGVSEGFRYKGVESSVLTLSLLTVPSPILINIFSKITNLVLGKLENELALGL